ncbi:exo-beta-N-acetylmuramidase NamZ family protein [Tenacibaculum sp. M341]|uniref:exo-beta-N-acetylmuramidase NamZ family protein n=1 Tax=Tenacibaculum sp. M341 TaxID=2530339 RepID=UPI0010459C4B|nr:DUF1343 domain-containing protein [Tenacibaculum sp. M341]TCI92794.1 DUF1343 domain-containing protein [Tenacibaculum sp. M341]
MFLNHIKSTYLFFLISMISVLTSCKQTASVKTVEENKENSTVTTIIEKKIIKTGADQTKAYIPNLFGKNVAIVANQTSRIQKTSNFDSNITSIHLVDYIHNSDKITVKKVFAPEHGFRGKADAGELIKNGKDLKTGLPIISLYGKNKKPTNEQLKGIDVVVFDIQDVGARFYTYISTLHYVMEACAENNIPLLLLDRPNPNGHYVDGPVLEMEHKSFVGMHPVPVVYGMTIGEYGKMINGEEWLKNGIQCDLTVVPLENYSHKTAYTLPVKPSPNLPNDAAINLYPSLCFFEGTNISVGRGTDHQFQIVGSPFYHLKSHYYSFTPHPNEGAKNPKHNNKECHGYDLSKSEKLHHLDVTWLKEFYDANKAHSKNKKFFTSFFTKLAGTKKLQQQIENGTSTVAIKNSWQKDLNDFKQTRSKYLLYE